MNTLARPIALPDTLLAWREWLVWFEPELARVLGDLIQKIDAALSKSNAHSRSSLQEPDGLGDLSRRGSYERLLSSEWLIAEEMPDEFLRRAGSGEHVFLAPTQRAKKENKLFMVLFDAGPMQLGSPRLVHLALWIILARRAHEAGGRMLWGVLQSPEKAYEATEADHLRKLLKARSYQAVNAQQVLLWQNWLLSHPDTVSECWHVGAPPGTEALLGADDKHLWSFDRQIITRPSLDGRTLEVKVQKSKVSKFLHLPMPNERLAKRLLEGRFEKGAPAQALPYQTHVERFSVTLPPVLSIRGNSVAVSLLDRPAALIFPFSFKPNAKAGKPRLQQWSAAKEPLSLFFSGNSLRGLLSDAETFEFWQFRLLRARPRPEPEVFRAAPGKASFLAAVGFASNTEEYFYALDSRKQLVRWEARIPQKNDLRTTAFTTRCHDTDVIGLAQVDSYLLVYAKQLGQSVRVSRVGFDEKRNLTFSLGEIETVSAVLFGAGVLWAQGFGACAFRLATNPVEIWRLYSPGLDHSHAFIYNEMSLSEGWRAIGIHHDPEQHSFELVLINQKRNVLALQKSSSVETLLTCAAKIAKAVVCPVNGFVALLLENRDLIVYSIHNLSVVLRVAGHSAKESYE
jgi:hypothetical protein